MVASPEAAPPRPPSLPDWLRGRTDRQLTALLRARPDLALPAPPDIAALAARLAVRSSVQRCLDGLDAALLQALEALALAADDTGEPITRTEPAGPLEGLLDRALVWGEPGALHLTPGVREALGPYPTGLGRPAARLLAGVHTAALAPVSRRLGLPLVDQPEAGRAIAAVLTDPQRLAGLLAELTPDERDIVERLASGPPVGTMRDTDLSAGFAPLPGPLALVHRGLLVPLDAQRVELPREVGEAVRATRAQPSGEAPTPRLVERTPAELDRLGTTAVLDSLRLIQALAETWTAQPPPTLRSGGLGVRELKRVARELDVAESSAALYLELAYAAGLINSTNGPEPRFLPTPEYDLWHAGPPAKRWRALAAAWLAMTRQPSLVNQRGDRERVITALSPDVERGTLPALRRQVLDVLAGLPPGSAPADREQVLALLAWHRPRRAAAQRSLTEAILAEADQLGLTAAGGLTGYGRTLVAGSPPSAEVALAQALPEPVDHFLAQPDLTLIVPGPPAPELAGELALLADLESSGGASVYRITERSVRRALDTGRTGEQLAAFVAQRSRTPVPQALEYLIDDAARRHGVLRAGDAGSYLRCDDPALLARAVSDRNTDVLHLRLLAPTVVISDAPVARLLDVLRTAGYAPAAEAADGGVITLDSEVARAPTRPVARSLVGRTAADSDAALGELVRRLRAGDALAGRAADPRAAALARQTPGVTSATTMERLRTAVREARLVWFGAAEANGSMTEHTLLPISLAAGTVRGYERGRSGLVSYPVHRITTVQLLDEGVELDDLDDH